VSSGAGSPRSGSPTPELPRRRSSPGWAAKVRDSTSSRFFLSDGYAASECFPGDSLGEIARNVLRSRAATALQYGPRAGYRPLRELIAKWLEADGVPALVDDIAIVTGAKQGLDVIARACTAPGDTLIGSEPTYMSGLRIFANAGLEMLPVAADADGTRVDEIAMTFERLAEAGAPLPRLIYEIPDFQNPSGSVLSEDRRERLVGIASRHDVAILEDNPYRWLRYEATPLKPLKSYDRDGTVLSVGSLAKILGPGLRVGWIHARGDRLSRILPYKADAGTSPLTQMIAHEFFSAPEALEHHLTRIRATLKPRRDQMLESLRKWFGGAATWTTPQGGYYVWVTLPVDIDGDALARKASEAGIDCYPGSIFFSDGRPRNLLRLSYSHETPERIECAVAKLAEVMSAIRNTLPSATATR
jgi:2-aminoadipate transaminase